MKVLLDENLPHALRRLLKGHDVSTVRFKRWDSLRNGSLLAAAKEEGFDVLLTMDGGFAHQQNPTLLPVAVVILSAPSNAMEDLVPLVPEMIAALDRLVPRTISHVG